MHELSSRQKYKVNDIKVVEGSSIYFRPTEILKGKCSESKVEVD